MKSRSKPTTSSNQSDNDSRSPSGPSGDNNGAARRISKHLLFQYAENARNRWNHKEIKLFFKIAMPSSIVVMNIFVPPCVVTSFVGRHYGTVCLSGASLSLTTGNLFSLSVLLGFLTAADTLQPQAFGAGNYEEVGVLAVRGFVGLMLLVVPANLILITYFEPMLTALGQTPVTIYWAKIFYRLYMIGIPFNALFFVLWKFLASQATPMPLVYNTIISLLLVFPVALILFTGSYGFQGTALTLAVLPAIQNVLLLAHLIIWKPHDRRTWPGLQLALRQTLRLGPFCRFFTLGLKGLVGRSGWIFSEGITLMVGTFGPVALSCQGVASQVVRLLLLPSIGTGNALAVRIGHILPRSVRRAKQLAMVECTCSVLFLMAINILLYVFRSSIFSLFTQDPDVIEGCELVWSRVCFYSFNMSFQIVLNGAGSGLGMQGAFATFNLIFLWCIGFPLSFYVVIMRGGGLNGARTCYFIPNVIINTGIMIALYFTDWTKIAESIREREGIEFEQESPLPTKA